MSKDLILSKLEIKGKKVYLDGQEIRGVVSYQLTEEAGQLAELTLTLLVKVGEVK